MTQPQTMSTHPAFASRKVLILALILGVLAAGLIVAYLASQEKSSGPAAPVITEQVVVAAKDIPTGTTITADMVQLKAIPKDSLIADPFLETKPVVGQVTRYPVAKGAQFSQSAIVANAKGTALSFEIPKGLRGVTIEVDTKNSPAALAVPGDFVDVLVAGPVGQSVSPAAPGAPTPVPTAESTSNNQPPTAVITVVQDVQVLAVVTSYVSNGVTYDQSTRGTASDAQTINNITLALTPAQAQSVFLASQTGKLTIALRAFGDKGTTTLGPIVGAVQAPTETP